jgi:asparagine synthetase B (glutamine-hydrolysing)
MCGISIAIRNNKDFTAAAFVKMNKAIAHRGPDGEGIKHFSTSGTETAEGAWQLALGTPKTLHHRFIRGRQSAHEL